MSVSKWLVLVAAVAGAMAQDPLAPDAGKPPTITTTVNASTSDDRVGDGVLAHKQAGNVSIGTQCAKLLGGWGPCSLFQLACATLPLVHHRCMPCLLPNNRHGRGGSLMMSGVQSHNPTFNPFALSPFLFLFLSRVVAHHSACLRRL
jgi:hypothetical protein